MRKFFPLKKTPHFFFFFLHHPYWKLFSIPNSTWMVLLLLFPADHCAICGNLCLVHYVQVSLQYRHLNVHSKIMQSSDQKISDLQDSYLARQWQFFLTRKPLSNFSSRSRSLMGAEAAGRCHCKAILDNLWLITVIGEVPKE